MTEDEKWLAEAKARLAQPAPVRHRKGSDIETVAACEAEIDTARAEGKKWPQIAADISTRRKLDPNSVRIALGRIKKARKIKVPVSQSAKTQRTASKRSNKAQIKPAPVDDSIITDLFAPMFDARDTSGRKSEPTPEREPRS